MGEGNEDEHRFGEYLVALVLGHEFDGAAVVQTVGQFDKHHAHVVAQGEQDALEVLGLDAFADHAAAAVFVVEHRLDLGEAFYQGGYLVAELHAEVFHGVVGVFHNVVQQGRGNTLVAQAYVVHHYLGHLDGMDDIRLAGTPAHVFVSTVGEVEGGAHHLEFLGSAAARTGGGLKAFPGFLDDYVVLYGKSGKTHSYSAS